MQPALTARMPRAEDTRAPAPLRRVSSAEVSKHLGLVNQVIARFVRKLPANVDRGDLLSAGLFGLLNSLERNGGDGGETFEGYARLRIRGAILDELRAQDWLTRRARWAANGQGQGGTETRGFEGPTGIVSLEEVVDPDRAPHLRDEHATDALEALVSADESRALRAAVQQLPERERTIVSMHYFEGARLKDIGRALGVSEPRVSQLHARAVAKLRQILARAAA